MTIYIDTNYKCHVTDDGTMTAVETDAFDGMCTEYIEGYRYVPAGQTWTREDGVETVGGARRGTAQIRAPAARTVRIRAVRNRNRVGGEHMTIEERKNAILAKIAEIQQGGTDEEKQDMQEALNILGVTVDE